MGLVNLSIKHTHRNHGIIIDWNLISSCDNFSGFIFSSHGPMRVLFRVLSFILIFFYCNLLEQRLYKVISNLLEHFDNSASRHAINPQWNLRLVFSQLPPPLLSPPLNNKSNSLWMRVLISVNIHIDLTIVTHSFLK